MPNFKDCREETLSNSLEMGRECSRKEYRYRRCQKLLIQVAPLDKKEREWKSIAASAMKHFQRKT